MVWEELIKLALIGTDRGQLTELSKDSLETMGINIKNPSTQVVLEGAALYAQIRKVGLPLTTRKQPLPLPANIDTQIICSRKSSQHLTLIINGNYEKALPEFVKTLKESNKRLPEETLPIILEKCLTTNDLWTTIQSSVGTRGIWLASKTLNGNN